VLDELPVCDRLAMDDVSKGWREACTTDTLHTAIGWAVFGDDGTSDERRLFHWRASKISKTRGPGSVEEGRELLPSALPLAARAEVKTQGRFILLVLRAVATVSRLLDGLAGGTTPTLDLQRCSEHVVATSSSRIFPSPARVHDRSPRDVSANVVSCVAVLGKSEYGRVGIEPATSKIVVSRAKPLGHRHFIHDLKPSWGLQIHSYYEYPPRVSLLLHDLVQFKYHPSGCHNHYTWVWGNQLSADVVADGSVQVRFDAGSVLRMAIFGARGGRGCSLRYGRSLAEQGDIHHARERGCPCGSLGGHFFSPRQATRAGTALALLQERVRAHATGSVRPHKAPVPIVRHHVHHWVRAAVALRSGLVAQFVGGMYAVDESRAADLLAFTVAVNDVVAAAWPTLTQPRRCMHWAPVERHIIWFAVEAFSFDARGGGTMDDVAAHAACLRVRQLCVTWGWRRRSALSSPPCMPPFDSCAKYHP